jgi:hypothetical protein
MKALAVASITLMLVILCWRGWQALTGDARKANTRRRSTAFYGLDDELMW